MRQITPDINKARSLLKMAKTRINMLKLIPKNQYASPLVEEYYEVIKELITALLAADGYKTLSHEELITYLNKYSEFTGHERFFTDNLRKLRNRIAYDGYFVREDYLTNKLEIINTIIDKLLVLLEKKIAPKHSD